MTVRPLVAGCVVLFALACGPSAGKKTIIDKQGVGSSAGSDVTFQFKGAKLVIPMLKDTVDGKITVYQPSAADITKEGFTGYIYEFALTPANVFSPVGKLTITGTADTNAVIARASTYDGTWTDLPTTYAAGDFAADVDGFALFAVRSSKGGTTDGGNAMDGGQTGGPCPGFIGSCNVVSASQCADVDSTDTAGDQMACGNSGGTWSSTDRCPAASKAGGCKLNASMIVGLPGASCKVQWYYSPLNSTDGVKLNCESFTKGIFLSP